MKKPKGMLTDVQAAEFLSDQGLPVSHWTLKKWRRKNEKGKGFGPPPIVFGGRVYYRVDQLREYIANGQG